MVPGQFRLEFAVREGFCVDSRNRFREFARHAANDPVHDFPIISGNNIVQIVASLT